MRSGSQQSRPEPTALCGALILVASLLLGGGGSPAPLLELALQGAVLLLMAAWFFASPQAWRAAPRQAWTISALVLAMPLLHLVPLPPALWQALPGRENQIAALELSGAADTWRAISLSPARTLASLLAAIMALSSLVLAACLSARGRWLLIAVIAAGGVLTLLVGAAQLSGGSASALRFFDREMIHLTGFQANRNSTADVILIAMLAVAALVRRALDRGWLRPSRVMLTAGIVGIDAVMILGLFLTASRTGLALLPLVLSFQYLIFQTDRQIHWRRLAASSAIVASLGAVSIALLRGNRAVETVVARFNLTGEFRPELWRDSLFALGQFWPIGSGQGTFVPVLMAVERLEVIDPTLPNRAHNDYLEFVMGAGLPGIIVLAALGFILLRAILKARGNPPAGSRAQALFATGTIGILALHSLVDYPLRSMSLAAIAATAVGLLLPARKARSTDAKGPQS